MVKMAEQAEQYKKIVEFIEKVSAAVDNKEHFVEESNLLSVAYKNVIGARRASWRIISSICNGENKDGKEIAELIVGGGAPEWVVRIGFRSKYF